MMILHKHITNLRGILASVCIGILGFALLSLGLSLDNPFWKETVKEVGATFLGIGILAFLWEMFTKRSFREETLALVNVGAELDKAGVEAIELAYLDAAWGTLIAEADQLDIFFAYGATWRGACAMHLRRLVERRNMKVRVILPNPASNECVGELARRFGYTTQKTIEKIQEGIGAFQTLQNECTNGSTVEIRLTDITPVFAIYLFGTKGVCTTYRHKPIKAEIPTHIVRRGGTLYAFLETEFEHLLRNSALVPIPQAQVAGGGG